MPTQLQKITVDDVTKQYVASTGLEPHKAFLFMVIDKYLAELELNSIDIETSIIDGSDDGGIDAVVIDEESATPTVYFFQSKYHLSDNSFEKTFPGNDVDKLKKAVEEFVLKGKINKNYQNQNLIDKLHSVKNLMSKSPRFVIAYCSNGTAPAASAQEKLSDFIEETNTEAGSEYLSVVYIDIDTITKRLIAPDQTKAVDFSLQTSGKYLTDDSGDVRLFLGAVNGNDLADLVEAKGDELFEKNVRGFLKKTNPINKEIIRSCSTDVSPYFVYMNNGITFTCEKYDFTPLESSPKVNLKNAQIVNGQQTSRSILQAKNEGKLKSDVKVLIRIVETSNDIVLPQIVQATNSQTKVTSRDLHSNDEVQRLIERSLESKGFYYEARKNKYQTKNNLMRVDAELAAQAFFSSVYERPAYAKDKKKELFGNDYESIFNEKLNPEEFLRSFLILREVRKLNRKDEYKQKYHFLNDAALHLTALIYRQGALDFEIGDISSENKKFVNIYKDVLKSTKKVVEERSKREGEKYENRRTFIDNETYGRIVEVLERK